MLHAFLSAFSDTHHFTVLMRPSSGGPVLSLQGAASVPGWRAEIPRAGRKPPQNSFDENVGRVVFVDFHKVVLRC